MRLALREPGIIIFNVSRKGAKTQSTLIGYTIWGNPLATWREIVVTN